ncbi:MAG: hypothetical protein N3E52_01450 [Candidatus Bathyarchaeota archaeon]|nr:hypothetical protein [Candidatus Bathyarchaeota archaeon]
MQVIDAEGKLVGKVKDISFIIGQQSISLSLEDKNGQTMGYILGKSARRN